MEDLRVSASRQPETMPDQKDAAGLRLFQPPESQRPTQPVFLLGVGCQKGGTTWLHNYLHHHPEADMGFRKEYHVLDAVNLPSCRGFVEKEIACGRRMLAWFHKPHANPGEYTLLDFYSSIEAYYDYFDFLATRSDGIRVVGDITPSYAGLPPDVYASVRRALEDRGIAVRVVFLMRDPVNRVWSAARMHRLKRQGIVGGDVALIRKMYRTPHYEFRTRYDQTIRSLESAFEPDQVHFEFYESLFSPEPVRRITDFLGLRFIRPDTETRLNASPQGDELPEIIQREVAEFYAPVYEFCAARFGAQFIGQIWPSYRFIAPNCIARAG